MVRGPERTAPGPFALSVRLLAACSRGVPAGRGSVR